MGYLLGIRDIVWRGCAPWRTHTSHLHDRRLWLELEAAGYRVEQRLDESDAGLVRLTGGWYWRVSATLGLGVDARGRPQSSSRPTHLIHTLQPGLGAVRSRSIFQLFC